MVWIIFRQYTITVMACIDEELKRSLHLFKPTRSENILGKYVQHITIYIFKRAILPACFA